MVQGPLPKQTISVGSFKKGQAFMNLSAFDNSFNLTPTEVARLFDAVDGLSPNTNPDWQDYPNRAVNEWGIGFTNNLSFISGISYIKDPGDDFLSFEERSLAISQLKWDRTEGAQYNDTAVNKDPISADRAQNAENFLNSLFWNDDGTVISGKVGQIRDGLDLDGDGKLSLAELNEIAQLDGDPNLSDTDFNLSFANTHKVLYPTDPLPPVDPPQNKPLPLPPQMIHHFLALYSHFFGSLDGLPSYITNQNNTNHSYNGSSTFA